jgi:hypothetical protein
LILIKRFYGGFVQPLAKRLLGVGYVPPSIPWRWRGKRLRHGGDVFVLVCRASKKPSKREFFVPARTDLAVKLLTANT